MKQLFIFGAIALGHWCISHAIGEEPRDQKRNEQRTIPLSEIITTSPQKELQPLREAWQKETNQTPQAFDTFMRQLDAINNGGSNVFIVDATNLFDALSASYHVLRSSHRTDRPAPVNSSQPKVGSHWMVAYLGTGPSNPTWWTLEDVKVGQGRVTLSYQESLPRPATDDVHHYYYWIPLSKLDPGVYELQLFDASKRTITLMRRVEIP